VRLSGGALRERGGEQCVELNKAVLGDIEHRVQVAGDAVFAATDLVSAASEACSGMDVATHSVVALGGANAMPLIGAVLAKAVRERHDPGSRGDFSRTQRFTRVLCAEDSNRPVEQVCPRDSSGCCYPTCPVNARRAPTTSGCCRGCGKLPISLGIRHPAFLPGPCRGWGCGKWFAGLDVVWQ